MWSKFGVGEGISVLFICAALCLIGAVLVGMVVNETNSISAGYIVDKQYTQAYFFNDVYHSAAYRFTIVGEKNS